MTKLIWQVGYYNTFRLEVFGCRFIVERRNRHKKFRIWVAYCNDIEVHADKSFVECFYQCAKYMGLTNVVHYLKRPAQDLEKLV